eukprot:CAMPEP_0185400974 /NCGR_PEP_ID=MMETSP1364-20130426/91059_1 /TAXON_ID=38817 /ORGANISM="Gephyrocapsa oceanica, Strain RCC1303" /LENGTH=127 /DNA_ID=CAMNT_0028003265 /DNA_START=535 /DNA_END=919 /DNA_ORIENTATION=-
MAGPSASSMVERERGWRDELGVQVASGKPPTSDETHGMPRSSASITTSGQHSCHRDGASKTRVCRKMTSTSSSGGSSAMFGTESSSSREAGSVHPVATAAKATRGIAFARASSSDRPFAGHGLTRVT